jgi:hypothetical protein
MKCQEAGGNEERYGFYSSPDMIRMIKSRVGWAEHVDRMGGNEKHVHNFRRKPEEKGPLGRPRCS